MVATDEGHLSFVRMLLDKGSSVSIVANGGVTAMHIFARRGYLAITTMLLVEADAEVEAADSMGGTPRSAAALEGHGKVMRVLIEECANPDSRLPDGETPPFGAAFRGHVGAIGELLRANADPSLTKVAQCPAVVISVPKDMAAAEGIMGVDLAGWDRRLWWALSWVQSPPPGRGEWARRHHGHVVGCRSDRHALGPGFRRQGWS